jgi:hypothetical protein
MGRFVDMSGRRSGILTAIKNTGKIGPRGFRVWIARCDCGNTIECLSSTFSGRGKKSCGCLAITPLHVIKSFMSQYSRGAKLRDYPFELSIKEFSKIVVENCYYCGARPVEKRALNKSYKLKIKVNGIDRVDNSKGYISGNCVACCEDCNFFKSSMSADKFLRLINRIYEHRKTEQIRGRASSLSGFSGRVCTELTIPL